MKRYKDTTVVTDEFDIQIIYDFEDMQIAASNDPRKDGVPVGPVISGDKKAKISEQMLADYESFISSIRELVEGYYQFEITSESDSESHSHYWELIAKQPDGTWIVKYRTVLRVATHTGHRIKVQQQQKKDFELKSRIPKDMKSKLKTLPQLTIIVNNIEFDSYDEAFIYIDSILERRNKIMHR